MEISSILNGQLFQNLRGHYKPTKAWFTVKFWLLTKGIPVHHHYCTHEILLFLSLTAHKALSSVYQCFQLQKLFSFQIQHGYEKYQRFCLEIDLASRQGGLHSRNTYEFSKPVRHSLHCRIYHSTKETLIILRGIWGGGGSWQKCSANISRPELETYNVSKKQRFNSMSLLSNITQ